MPYDRVVHFRDRDHIGQDSDLYVGIDAAIGPFPAQTPVKYVLEALASDLYTLQSANRHVATFTLNAYVLAPGGTAGNAPGNIRSAFFVNAIAKKAVGSSFTVNAYIQKGATFTIDAWVRGHGTFTINAFII
jgi:hypothetical protein